MVLRRVSRALSYARRDALDSVNIQIASDLHLETPLLRPRYETFDLPVSAPYLALLGDIGKTNHPGLFVFLQKQLQRYKTVFFLLGNHEAYRIEEEYSSYARARELVKAFELEVNDPAAHKSNSRYGRFVFLERTRHDIPQTKITVLGRTLFSHIPAAQQESVTLKVSDFAAFGPDTGRIDDWNTDAHNAAHALDLDWLNKTVDEIESESPNRHVIIFTHYSPTRLDEANDPMHLEDTRQVNSAFSTDLSHETCWNSKIVKIWAFGHTHFNCDFVQSNKSKQMRVVTNQRGYFRSDEAPGFDETKTVSLKVGSTVGWLKQQPQSQRTEDAP